MISKSNKILNILYFVTLLKPHKTLLTALIRLAKT